MKIYKPVRTREAVFAVKALVVAFDAENHPMDPVVQSAALKIGREILDRYAHQFGESIGEGKEEFVPYTDCPLCQCYYDTGQVLCEIHRPDLQQDKNGVE